MDLTTGLVFLIVFLISYYVYTRPRNLPPGPGGIPILSSLLFVAKFRHKRPHMVLAETARRYGHVMSFTLGKVVIVVLTGYDAVHEALVNQADVFSDRPSRKAVSFLGETGEFHERKEFIEKMLRGGLLLGKYGDTWRRTRRFTLQSLRDFGVGKTSIEEKIFTELDVVGKAFQDSEGEPIDTSNYTQKLVGNVLFGIVFGKRYDYDDPEFDRIRIMLSTLISGPGFISPSRVFPSFIMKLLNRKEAEHEAEKMRCVQRVRRFIATEIREHEDTFDSDHVRDFVDLYLKSQQETKSEDDEFEKANMFRVIMDLFIAGSETTYTTLDWALLYMSEFPEIQAKCQQEIQEVFADKPVQYSDRGKLPYLEATLMEIQRISVIVPLSVVHSTTRETTLCGYTIPKGVMVIPNLYSVTHDPKHWDQPLEFRPERFLDAEGNIVKNEAFMPFSTGPRICLGEPLAKMELFLVFTNLLQRFTFHRETSGVAHSLESKQNQITNAPTSYKLRVHKRA